MSSFPERISAHWPAIEVLLALLVFGTTAMTLTETMAMLPRQLGVLWLPATVLFPALLASSVLLGVGIRLGSIVRDRKRKDRSRRAAVVELVVSFVLGLAALYTLVWVFGTVYVLFFGTTGGVMLAPFATVVVASGLGVLVLFTHGGRAIRRRW